MISALLLFLACCSGAAAVGFALWLIVKMFPPPRHGENDE